MRDDLFTDDDDRVVLICGLADAPFCVRGSSFRHFCSRCYRRVMVAPSGQRWLVLNPEAAILCSQCFVATAPKNAKIVEVQPEQIGELCHMEPNPWRLRN